MEKLFCEYLDFELLFKLGVLYTYLNLLTPYFDAIN